MKRVIGILLCLALVLALGMAVDDLAAEGITLTEGVMSRES